MKKYSPRLIAVVLLVIVSVAPFITFAATIGTIDTTYKYAWSENLGWINFGTPEGNVTVTDTQLNGYAWNQNTGWINLNVSTATHVINDGQGNLSGYAWGEGIGYINFSGVTIDSSGYFHGNATSTLSGRISFNCLNTNSCGNSNFSTKTNWQAAVPVVSAGSGGYVSGGSSGGGYVPNTSVPSLTPSTSPTSSIVSVPSVAFLLQLGDSDPAVKALQVFLNTHGYPVTASGRGSAGKEIDHFGVFTKAALKKFQQASNDPGVISELGTLGPKTQAYIASFSTGIQADNVVPAVVATCPPYLTTYIKKGGANNATEVKKLQAFLMQYQGFTSLGVTGIYDQPTFAAVLAFQTKYKNDILVPWKLRTATGYVYKTTENKINQLYCGYQSKSS